MFLLRLLPALCLASSLLFGQQIPKPNRRAKNVIVFLADAGGIPTLNAASLVGYGEPQKLFVQSWPYMAFPTPPPRPPG